MDKLKFKRIFLFVLLILISLIIRVQKRYPTHPDHFTLGEYTNALIKRGYAPWVLHPFSLFGYYPLSVPSGFEFFFSYLSAFSGLDLPVLFFAASIIFGVFGGIGVYILIREFFDFRTAFVSSLVLLTMVFFSNVTSNTASSRIFNIVFYPYFILILFKIYGYWQKNKKINIRYILTSGFLFLLMALIHRLSQLSIIFIVSFVLAVLVYHWEKLLEFYKKTKLHKKRKDSYEESKLHVVFDLAILFFVLFSFSFIKMKLVFLGLFFMFFMFYLVLHFTKIRSREFVVLDIVVLGVLVVCAKVLDLALRKRFLHHLEKLLPYVLRDYVLMGLGVLGIICLVLLIVFFKRLLIIFKKTIDLFETVLDKFIVYFEKNPEKVISFALLFVFFVFISMTFLKGGIFDMDESYYERSFLLKGESKLIVLANFLLNLNNNLTVLIWFAPIGILYLFLKKNKTMHHYFFMFVAIFFSQFIFDWEYIRLYMNPIYAIFIGFGLSYIIRFILNLKKDILRHAGIAAIVLVFIFHFSFGMVFMNREYVFDALGLQETYEKVPEQQYLAAADYLKGEKNISVLWSSGWVRVGHITLPAKITEAVTAQSIFVNEEDYNISRITVSEIIEDIKSGNKIRNFYELNDWYFGSNYYHGRHIFHILNNDFRDRYYKTILNRYNIRYLYDSDVSDDKNMLFESVKPLKNKVYTTPNLDMYDLEKGRA
ncbi:hypothetical protein GF327_01620 [Candidatus Woesearchaeota archaeon]|nr:hypothetical protein [Candidatus Woesearchaeota archaeon]